MCGIAGCLTAPGRGPDRAALERMADALAHRGPDGAGVEVVGSVGLVHRRLAIVDPTPAGAQPMASPGGWWLTYNGEVFNHLALRDELGGVAWRGGCDTETLLHALERWDEEAVGRLNGLFAFAALDTTRRRLLLARDRLGIKPLFLARHAGALWFASEIGALVAAGVPARPRREVVRHAVLGWPPGATTPFEGIERLPAGTLAWIDLETLELRERRWWRPADLVDPDLARELAGRPRAALAAEVEGALRASVRRRLMADVPVATLCSGGVDSSLITLFAAEEGSGPGVLAVNASVAEQPEWDEGPWARAVAEHAGAELHTLAVTGDRFRTDLVRTVEHHELPLYHPGSVPMVGLAALAREQGAKVLLSGEGADELLGGYEWQHPALLRAFLARRSPVRLARALAAHLRATRTASSTAAFARDAERAAHRDARRAYRHHPGPRGRLEAALAADLELYLIHLLARQDTCTMASSVETRVPFLDPGVVRLSLNLPLEARVQPERKALLRDLARRLLPGGVADRPKVGFHFATRPLIEARADPRFLLDGRLREVLGVTREQWRADVAAMPDEWALRVWSAEIWCRLAFDRTPRAAVEAALWPDGPAGA